LLERHVSEQRTGDELVQRVDISLVVLTVVKPKRLRRDNRLERVLGVGCGGSAKTIAAACVTFGPAPVVPVTCVCACTAKFLLLTSVGWL